VGTPKDKGNLLETNGKNTDKNKKTEELMYIKWYMVV